VVEVDVARKRIALTMKLGEKPAQRDNQGYQQGNNRFEGAARGQQSRGQPAAQAPSAMASAFSKLQALRK
jgi:uncharacterized protein